MPPCPTSSGPHDFFNLELAELPKAQNGSNARLPLRCTTDYEALLLKFTKIEILSL